MTILSETDTLRGAGVAKLPRQSNIEALRILATFFILVVHANFMAFGPPARADCVISPGWSLFRFLIQAVASVGVDVFVLISGWFGIRPSRKSLSELAFQFFFFAIGLHVAAIPLGAAVGSLKEALLDIFLLSHWNWFLKAYVGLVVLAPVLNAYCDERNEPAFRLELIAFFALQTAWGWLARDTQSFRNGQSIVSFIGLYLLARYVRLHRPAWTLRRSLRDFAAYGFLSLSIAASGFAATLIGWKGGVGTVYSNSSPFVILAALFLFLGFSKIPFRSQTLNRIAKSSYASYLVHTHPCVFRKFFLPSLRSMMESGAGGVLHSTLFLVAVYGVSVLLDQVRRLLWSLFTGDGGFVLDCSDRIRLSRKRDH